MKAIKLGFAIAAGALITNGCVTLDKSSVRASAGAPESAQVAEVDIPYNDTLPRYVMAVELVRFTSAARERITRTTTTRESEAAQRSRENYRLNKSFDENYNRNDKSQGAGWSREGRRSQNEPQAQTDPPRTQVDGRPGVYAVANANSRNQNPSGSVTVRDGKSNSNNQRNSNLKRQATIDYAGQRSGEQNRTAEVVVERYDASRTSGLASNQRQIAAQFTSALTSVGNFSVLDFSSVNKIAGGRYSAEINDGEVGPFIVRAQITEYEARVEEEKSKVNVLLAKRGNQIRKGIVALDVSILDGRSGRIVRSFPVRGTFAKQDKSGEVGFGLYEKDVMAKSVLDQALRVALNEAAEKAYEALSTRYR